MNRCKYYTIRHDKPEHNATAEVQVKIPMWNTSHITAVVLPKVNKQLSIIGDACTLSVVIPLTDKGVYDLPGRMRELLTAMRGYIEEEFRKWFESFRPDSEYNIDDCVSLLEYTLFDIASNIDLPGEYGCLGNAGTLSATGMAAVCNTYLPKGLDNKFYIMSQKVDDILEKVLVAVNDEWGSPESVAFPDFTHRVVEEVDNGGYMCLYDFLKERYQNVIK